MSPLDLVQEYLVGMVLLVAVWALLCRSSRDDAQRRWERTRAALLDPVEVEEAQPVEWVSAWRVRACPAVRRHLSGTKPVYGDTEP